MFFRFEKTFKDSMRRILECYSNSKSEIFDEYWYTDQKIATKILFAGGGKDKINFVKRGQYPNGFARGRVDRGKCVIS